MQTNMYHSDNQGPADGGVCDPNDKIRGRARFGSFRFQRGIFTATNSSGALTIAAGSQIKLFQRGVGGSASDAGFPSGVLFTDADTNIADKNGLANCEVTHVGAAFGRPHGGSVSGSVFTLAESDVLESYQEGLVHMLSESTSIIVTPAADEQAPEFVLGNVSLNPAHRGLTGANFPGAHAMTGLPPLLARRIDVPPATGSERGFAILLRVERQITFAARSTPAVGSVYVPVTVSVEIAPREQG